MGRAVSFDKRVAAKMCFIPVVLGLVLLLWLECSFVTERFPQYSGTILMFKSEILTFDLQSGSLGTIELAKGPENASRFLAAGHGGSLMLLSYMSFQEERWGRDRHESETRIYVYEPLSPGAELVQELNVPGVFCNSLDYYSVTNSFLLCGVLRDQRGVFVLDSNFAEIDDLTLVARGCAIDASGKPAVLESAPTGGFFIDSTRIAIDLIDGVFLIDLGSQSCRKLHAQHKHLLGATRDRRTLVLARRTVDEDTIVELFRLEGDSAVFVERVPGFYCFSPDEKVIAYGKTEGILDDLVRIWLYDLETKENYKTNLVSGASFSSSMVWVEEVANSPE